MNTQSIALETAAALILDHQLWADCKMFVHDIDGKTGISNQEKHAKVMKDLVFIFGDIGTTLLDIAIKIAVLWLKTQKVQPATSEN